MKRIAIIGGGISGLSAAYALEEKRRAGLEVQYVLYEASARFGGVLVTDRVDGCILEAGPDSFLTEKPWATDLCAKLGLAGQLIGSNDADRKTYILVRGKLVEMPDGLMFMVPTKLAPTIFSPMRSTPEQPCRPSRLRLEAGWFLQACNPMSLMRSFSRFLRKQPRTCCNAAVRNWQQSLAQSSTVRQ